MTALSADVNIQQRDAGLDIRSYKVADNVVIYKGSIVALDASGYARPARSTAGELIVGVAIQKFDNTITGHAAGGRDALGQAGVRVASGADFLLLCSASASQASVGQPFYALDDATVRATVGTGGVAGIVREYVDATHVWVHIPTPIPANVAPQIQGNLTAIDGDVRITAGNLRLGAISTFGTTEPTSAVVMKTGTAPVGAITTSGGLFSSTTVVRKIIADGTASNVET